MINLFAGLRSQITLLKEKLKKHNPTKNPKVYKEILDALEAAEKRYSAERAKRIEKQKAKEQKAQEVAKEDTPKVEDDNVVMPKKEFVDEHEKLVKELEPMVEEHKEQGAELEEVKKEAAPKCAICGVEFKSWPEYNQHREQAHSQKVEVESSIACPICGGAIFKKYDDYKKHHQEMHPSKPLQAPPVQPKKDYVPMDPEQKKQVVKDVEKSLGPAIIGSEEPEASLLKFSIDDVVKPVRGSESKGRVMRWDGKPNDLVYVFWDDGILKDKHVAGGYYPEDLVKVEEPKEINAEGNPPPPDTSIVPPHNPGPEHVCPD